MNPKQHRPFEISTVRCHQFLLDAVVIVSYAAITAVLFWPVLPHLTSAVIGGSPAGRIDSWQGVWGLWWIQYALVHRDNPFFTTKLYYPTGANLFLHALNSPTGLAVAPITALFGPIAAFNSAAMLAFVGSGYAMFVVARRYTGSRFGAWLAGILFTFSPYHITKLNDGLLNLVSIQYLPLFVLCLKEVYDRLGQRIDRRFVALTSGLLVLITLTDQYYGLFSIMFLGLYAAVSIVSKRSWSYLGRVIGVSLLIVLPLLIVVGLSLTSTQAGLTFADWKERQILSSATPLDFLVPNPNSPLWGQHIEFLNRQRLAVGGTSVGLAVLVLSGLGVYGYWRRNLVWVVLVALIFLLELGPQLVINGHVTAVQLPYALLNLAPGLSMARRPNHFIVYRSVILAILAASGWAFLRSRIAGKWLPVVAICLIGAIVVDLWPVPLPRVDATISPFYRTLASSSGGAVLELPPLPRLSDYMAAQIVHQHPIMGGYLSRDPVYPIVERVDGIRQLWSADPVATSIAYPEWERELPTVLATYGIEYVVLHLDKPNSAEYTRLQDALNSTLDLVYHDATMIAYRRPVTATENILLTQGGTGWYPLEHDQTRHWQWMNATADLTVVNPTGRSQDAVLEFTAAAFVHDRNLTIDQLIDGQWKPINQFVVTPAEHPFTVQVHIVPGETALRLVTTADAAPAGDPRHLGVVYTRLELIAPGVQPSR